MIHIHIYIDRERETERERRIADPFVYHLKKANIR